MSRVVLIASLAAAGAGNQCCWSKWGDASSCGNYPAGGSGPLCGNDGVTVCQSNADCDSVPVPTPAPTPVPTPLPTPRVPLYVVLRMDDVSLGWFSETQAGVVNWALKNDVKLVEGLVVGTYPYSPGCAAWPTTCLADASAAYCDDLVVAALNSAYREGRVRTAENPNATIEIADHSFYHGTWREHFEATDGSFKTWVHEDMQMSTAQIRAAFPGVSLRTFIAPENLADADALAAMEANGLDIVSVQGTLGCKQAAGQPPFYNYYYAPCQHDGAADCIPPNDVYITDSGFQKLSSANVFSMPIGSANSDIGLVDYGISAEATFGEGTCGCGTVESRTVCSIVSSAEGNAVKSNGVRWTALMMHPQTTYNGQSYVEWLDGFLALARASPTYEVHFVHFQDLADLIAAAAPAPFV